MKRKHLSLAIGCVLLSSVPVAWAQDAAPALPTAPLPQSGLPLAPAATPAAPAATPAAPQ